MLVVDQVKKTNKKRGHKMVDAICGGGHYYILTKKEKKQHYKDTGPGGIAEGSCMDCYNGQEFSCDLLDRKEWAKRKKKIVDRRAEVERWKKEKDEKPC